LQTALVFLYHASGILEQPTDIVPHRRIERLDTDRPGLASALSIQSREREPWL